MLKGTIHHANGYWHLSINGRQERFVTLNAALDAWSDESTAWAAEQASPNSVEYEYLTEMLDDYLEVVG